MFDPSILFLDNYPSIAMLGLVVVLSFFNGPSILSKKNDDVTKQDEVTKDGTTGVVKYSLDGPPVLKHVPSLPLVGSMIPWYSKIPVLSWDKEREWLVAIREKYGDFYSIGIPGLGQGIYGTIYYISDPREYMKIVRMAGAQPSGLIESMWPLKKYFKERNKPLVQGPNDGFFGRGKDWKVIRSFLQTDLMSPTAANGYIPGIILAAKQASKVAPICSHDLNLYLNRCTFDLFSTVMFGEITHAADPNYQSDPITQEFITSSMELLGVNFDLMYGAYETIMGTIVNYPTAKYRQSAKAGDKVSAIAAQKIHAFYQRYNNNKLNELEKNSYLANAIERQRSPEHQNTISHELLIDIATTLFSVSIDTTGGLISWALLHVALNPEIQGKIHDELINNVTIPAEGSGKLQLSPDLIHTRSKTPYLLAFLRECHRVTPAATNTILRHLENEIEIHGQIIPANSKFFFNNYPIQMDPSYIDNPNEFRPERWLPDAVEARKGTPREVIDHPFFSDSFSQGARRCPGHRVASNELVILLSQWILDYTIRAPNQYKTYTDVPYTLTSVAVPILPKLVFIPRD